MNYLEIDIVDNKSINVSLICVKCGARFNPELDLRSDTEGIYKKNEVVYCYDCEKPYEFEKIIENQKLKIKFLNKEVSASLNHSDSIDKSEEVRIPYNYKRALRFYRTQIRRLKKLLEIKHDETSIVQTNYRLIFSGVITTLETYMNEVLLFMVLDSDLRLRIFVEKYEPYQKETFRLNQVFKKHDMIYSRVEHDLNKLIYHSLPKMIRIFDIYDFDLAKYEKIKSITKSIKLRHNFVHRSGLDDNDNLIILSEDDVLNLIDNVDSFVLYVNQKADEYLHNQFKIIF